MNCSRWTGVCQEIPYIGQYCLPASSFPNISLPSVSFPISFSTSTQTMFFRYYNRKYIFPAQFVVCIVGNVINLIVLSGRNMRTKTNFFLTAMAVADLAFFSVLLFPSLEYKVMEGGAWLQAGQAKYRNLYYLLHIPLVAFANWFSAASIWLTVAVTLDRLIATKPGNIPTVYRSWNKKRTFLLIITIYILSLLLSLYHFAWRRVEKRSRSNVTLNSTGADYVYVWATVSESEYVWYWYVQSCHLLSGLLVVVGPLLLLFFLNCVIMYRLRIHNRNIGGSLFPTFEAGPSTRRDRRASAVERTRIRERRITFTVVSLVTVFIIFNLPSGIFSIIEFMGTIYAKVIFKKSWYWDLGEVCNALVCTGKAINFCLYCTASSDYRRELRNVFTCRRCRRTRGTGAEWAASSVSLTRVSSCSGLRRQRSVNFQMSQFQSNRTNGSAPD